MIDSGKNTTIESLYQYDTRFINFTKNSDKNFNPIYSQRLSSFVREKTVEIKKKEKEKNKNYTMIWKVFYKTIDE